MKDKNKFESPEKPPEGLNRELLEVLIEECAEVQQRATKIFRFGLTEVQPGQEYNNSQRLAFEIGDLNETIRRLLENKTISEMYIKRGEENKYEKLKKYLQND